MNSTTIKAISGNKLLKNVDVDNIDHSAIEGKLKIVREGKIIYRLGDQAQEVFLIIKGDVNFVTRDQDGSQIKKMSKDDFFGHDDLFGDGLRSNTAVAATDLYLLQFSFDEFSALLNFSPEMRENAGIEDTDETVDKNNFTAASEETDDDIYQSYEDDEEIEKNEEDSSITHDDQDDDGDWLRYAEPEEDENIDPQKNSEAELESEKVENDFSSADFENYDDKEASEGYNISELDDQAEVDEEESSVKQQEDLEEISDEDWSSYQDYLDSETHEENLEKQELFDEDSTEPGQNERETLNNDFQNYEDLDLEEHPEEDTHIPDQTSDDQNDHVDHFEKRELTTKGEDVEIPQPEISSKIEQNWLLQKLPLLFEYSVLHEILKNSVNIFNELFEPDHIGFAYSNDFNNKLKFIIDKKNFTTELNIDDPSVSIPDFLDSNNPISLRSHEFNKDLIPENLKDSVENIEGLLYVPVNSENRKFIGVIILISETKEFDNTTLADAEILAKFCSAAIDNSIRLEAKESSIRNSAFESFKKIASQNVKQPLLVSERFAEYLNKQELSDEIQSAIESLLDSLKNASQGLLFFEELDSSNEIKHKVKVDFNYLVKQTIESFNERIDDTKIKLELELQENILVSVFPEDLKLVITEILKNAYESMSEGQIEISSIFEDQTVLLKIKDNGCGIPIKERDKIFEPFYSFNKIDRAGLGLTVARAILNKYEGKIEIGSKLDEGTTVTIFLPGSIE